MEKPNVQLREAEGCVDTTPDLLCRLARSQSTSSLALVHGRYLRLRFSLPENYISRKKNQLS